MKAIYTFFAFLLFASALIGQTLDPPASILLTLNFEGTSDPADTMLNEPTGDDLHWVNYDQDHKTGLCVQSPGITPKAWYWESDLGAPNPSNANNNAFTSCSFLSNENYQNRNWLITAPVYVPDDTYWLCWRSLSYYGPDFMDGYHVLVSTSSNLTGAFSDTIFSAAQTVDRLQVGSLDLNDYIFSNGYIHANGYTDTSYFYIDSEPLGDFYHGKLEPHCVSLAEYAGESIYIAFLHDSKDDYQLQVDDILVSNQNVATKSPDTFDYFNLLPNPMRDFGFVSWKTNTPQAGHMRLFDQSGRIVLDKPFNARLEGQMHLEGLDLAPGIYFCRLETASGQATKLWVKL